MSSRDIFEESLRNALITTNITLEQFENIISTTEEGKQYSKDQIEYWYNQYLEMDKITLKDSKTRFAKFLSNLRRSQLRQLESSELSESFKLEELINTLYTVDGILSTKLQVLDKEIIENVKKLEEFNEELEKAQGNTSSNDNSLTHTLQTISKYKNMIGDSTETSTV